MFFNLEELYIQAMIAEVPYTMAQLVDQALDKIKKTGIFTNSVTAWAARDPNDKNWQNLKAHLSRPTMPTSRVGPPLTRQVTME